MSIARHRSTKSPLITCITKNIDTTHRTKNIISDLPIRVITSKKRGTCYWVYLNRESWFASDGFMNGIISYPKDSQSFKSFDYWHAKYLIFGHGPMSYRVKPRTKYYLRNTDLVFCRHIRLIYELDHIPEWPMVENITNIYTLQTHNRENSDVAKQMYIPTCTEWILPKGKTWFTDIYVPDAIKIELVQVQCDGQIMIKINHDSVFNLTKDCNICILDSRYDGANIETDYPAHIKVYRSV